MESDIAGCAKCPNHKFHVLKIGSLEFCNGCFANNVFLGLLLPIYLLFLIDFPSKLIPTILMLHIVINVGLHFTSISTGKFIFARISSIFTSIFMLAAHFIILYFSHKFNFTFEFIFGMITILALPQFAMYFWKIRTSNEFRYPKSKFMIRMLFIHAYLFAVLLIKSHLVLALSAILITALSFAGLREISAIKVQQANSSELGKNTYCTGIKSRKVSGIKEITPYFRSGESLRYNDSAEGDCVDCCMCCSGCYCLMCMFGAG